MLSLPLLYFTNAMVPVASYTWCDGECHHLHLEEDVLEGRFFSSHGNDCMVLTIDDEDCLYLHNTGTRQWIALTDDIIVTAPLRHGIISNMFWRVGNMRGWGCHDTSLNIERDEGVDILHYHGRFYFLTIYEHIVIVHPHVNTTDEVLHPDVHVLWFANGPDDNDHTHERYLVESREEILIVQRGKGCNYVVLYLKAKAIHPKSNGNGQEEKEVHLTKLNHDQIKMLGKIIQIFAIKSNF